MLSEGGTGGKGEGGEREMGRGRQGRVGGAMRRCVEREKVCVGCMGGGKGAC